MLARVLPVAVFAFSSRASIALRSSRSAGIESISSWVMEILGVKMIFLSLAIRE